MTQEIDLPLGSPPRKAHYRRGIRNARRAYRTLFVLIIFAFAGWAVLDIIQWYEPANGVSSDSIRAHPLHMAIGHGLVAFVTLLVLIFVEHPLRRELRLARRGDAATGQLLAVHPPLRRRRRSSITYCFRTATGVTVECSCTLPRRVRIADLNPGMSLEVLYEPREPQLNRPRLAFDHVEFGDVLRKKPAP
jgi:hypothetical protein